MGVTGLQKIRNDVDIRQSLGIQTIPLDELVGPTAKTPIVWTRRPTKNAS